ESRNPTTNLRIAVACGSAIRTLRSGVAILMVATSGLVAQKATQTVGFRVDPIDQIAVQGAPVLIVSNRSAVGPTRVTSGGATWNVTTNQNNAKVTASLGAEMPAGVTLSVSLGAPAGGVSAGLKPLGLAAVEVITSVGRVAAANLPMSYQLDVAATASAESAASRVVTFTITGGN
ncbi:MAG TPA: hypothetical protein VII52_08020, partial [Gemmatimonadaceae bacterium]